jgi:hypothetical protein
MEFKGNYGPHLIIVPNAVLVNWKVHLLCPSYIEDFFSFPFSGKIFVIETHIFS